MEQENEQKASFGMKLLSFLIPLAGLILFACNISSKPKYAKGCGIAALIGFIITIIIFLSFPVIIGLGLAIYNNSLTSMEETDYGTEFISQKVATFNAKFEPYEGDKVKASEVRLLLSMVKSNNIMYDDNQVIARVDGVKVNSTGDNVTISTGKYYKVEMKYNSITGYIYQINITSNN